MTHSVEDKARAELFRRRAELLEVRDDLTEEEAGLAGREVETDFTDRATQAEASLRLTGLDEAERRELVAIEAAIARLDAGTYGTCEVCGGRIAGARLLAIPETTICIACAQLAEDRSRPLGRRP